MAKTAKKQKNTQTVNTGVNTSVNNHMKFYSHTYVDNKIVNSSSPKSYGRLKDIKEKQDKSELLKPNNIDFLTNTVTTNGFNISTVSSNNNFKYENPFKLSPDILTSTNKYKFVFDKVMNVVLEDNMTEDGKFEAGQEVSAIIHRVPGVPSLFNPYYGLTVIGVVENQPLVHSDTDGAKAASSGIYVSTADNVDKDITDCSIKTLVKLSNERKLGRAMYKYADFMYCKDLGKIANNHLITLRRFAVPIGDDIWSDYSEDENKIKKNTLPPDIGRLVCYLNEDNKLEEILKYNYKDTWQQFQSEIEQKQSEADNEDRGIIGSIVNLGNSQYRSAVKNGTAGSGNKILGWIAGKSEISKVKLLNNKGTYENHEILGNYDKHKIYTKKGTVQDTHIYEGKLQFSQEFTLVFDYELRAYDNINPKSAFLDLLGNIMAVTYKKGSFWGGEQKLIGAPENKRGWELANDTLDNALNKVGSFVGGIIGGDIGASDILGMFSNLASSAKSMFGDIASAAGSWLSGTPNEKLEKWQSEAKSFLDNNDVGGLFKGMIKNQLGRPSLYAFSSLLTGDPVGLWHITIGNPRNPIMSMGNMILTDSTVQHYGPLGIDDFPTGLKVSITLKHAKSRDAVEISKMYTKGTNGIYQQLTNTTSWTDYFDLTKNNVFGADDNRAMDVNMAATLPG